MLLELRADPAISGDDLRKAGDLSAHEFLARELGRLRPGDAILSEEGKDDQARLTDELGDVLFAVANLARHCKVDPEAALRATNDKFERRFRYIERQLAEAGRKPVDASLEEMEALWQEAKTRV